MLKNTDKYWEKENSRNCVFHNSDYFSVQSGCRLCKPHLHPTFFLNTSMQIHDDSGSQKNFRLFEEESIDDSVYRRMEQDPSYHPLAKNFPDKKADYV